MTQAYSQQGSNYEFDALVIGSGLAGLHYCMQLIQLNPKLSIALISKAELNECNSRYAQGGIAAVFSPEDSIQSHVTDTLKAGDGLNDPLAVESILTEGPGAIEALQAYQIKFNQLSNGDYALAREGGHSHRRIVNCGDETGLTVTNLLVNIIRQQPQIQCFEHHVAVNLIVDQHPSEPNQTGEVLGAYILDCHNNRIDTFAARCVILATGGAGKIYRYTSNPMVATGDGVAMAYRAGARVANMEFYQFHPTLLYHPVNNNFLISEAVRGEGALLKHPTTGERFLKRYAPEQMELATRDIVSRAIFNEIEHSDVSFVHMDITHQSKSFLQKRFPQIYRTLLSIGIDMSQDLIPVVPAAHYQCGGIVTNVDGQTDLKRLYAIGEVAMSGLHGANRLASNSLLESVVMAKKSALSSLNDIAHPTPKADKLVGWSSATEVNERRASQINAHWRSLRGEMTSYAGIVRTEAGLTDLLQLILKRYQIIEKYYWTHSITRDFIELRNIILNAELIVQSALSRRESRGGHFREDFPHKNPLSERSVLRLNSPKNPYL